MEDQDVDGRTSKIRVEVNCNGVNANQNNMDWKVLLNMVLKLRFSF